MSVEEILEILRTSIETKDWDVISELIETLVMKVSPMEMNLKSILRTLTIKYGGDLEIDWYWLILKCQSLSRLLNKTQQNSIAMITRLKGWTLIGI